MFSCVPIYRAPDSQDLAFTRTICLAPTAHDNNLIELKLLLLRLSSISASSSSLLLPRADQSLQVVDEVSGLVLEDCSFWRNYRRFNGAIHDQNWFLYDKVTVLESEKRAWESSPEAQAVKEALNPWRNHPAEATKDT